MNWIYLDNNATTQPDRRVIEAMTRAMTEDWANPSSVHRLGQAARQKVELARYQVASLIGARPNQLIFTSGGTEANNLAIRGVGQRILLTSAVEHTAIMAPVEQCRSAGQQTVVLSPDATGLIQPDALAKALKQYVNPRDPALVSLQWANNETGVIAPIAQLAQVAHAHGDKVLFHTDATQAVGKIPVNVQETQVDLLTLAGHKFHGPKGVGALFLKPGLKLLPQILGGAQETQRRGGTENVPGILGMGQAAQLAQAFLKDPTQANDLEQLRDHFEQTLLRTLPDTFVNPDSSGVKRLWNTTNLGFARLQSEAILMMLSEKGLCVSAGAACSSGSLEPSPVLLAMGVPQEVAHGSLRFSLSRFTTREQIDQALRIVIQTITRLRKIYDPVLSPLK